MAGTIIVATAMVACGFWSRNFLLLGIACLLAAGIIAAALIAG